MAQRRYEELAGHGLGRAHQIRHRTLGDDPAALDAHRLRILEHSLALDDADVALAGQRVDASAEALDHTLLERADLVYACSCSRKAIEASVGPFVGELRYSLEDVYLQLVKDDATPAT